MGMNFSTRPAYNKIARDPRINIIRNATAAEVEGEKGWVMVHFTDGLTYRGETKFLAASVTEVRSFLKELEYTE